MKGLILALLTIPAAAAGAELPQPPVVKQFERANPNDLWQTYPVHFSPKSSEKGQFDEHGESHLPSPDSEARDILTAKLSNGRRDFSSRNRV